MKYESSWINDDVRMFRDNVRAFIAKEFVPQQARWRAQHGPDAEDWLRAARPGLLRERTRLQSCHSASRLSGQIHRPDEPESTGARW